MDISEFAQSFYDALKQNENYQKLIVELVTPSKSKMRQSEISSVAGAVVAKAVGLGWHSSAGAAIALKDNPIVIMTMVEHKDYWKAKVCFYFLIEGHVTNEDLHKQLRIEPIKKGVISRETVGVKMRFDHIGKDKIENDKDLNDKILKLFRTKKMSDISDWTPAPITINIEEKDKRLLGKIEACVEMDMDKESLRTLFECAQNMAQHVQTSLESRG